MVPLDPFSNGQKNIREEFVAYKMPQILREPSRFEVP